MSQEPDKYQHVRFEGIVLARLDDLQADVRELFKKVESFEVTFREQTALTARTAARVNGLESAQSVIRWIIGGLAGVIGSVATALIYLITRLK